MESEYFIDLDQNKIHVKENGAGPPIIFTHGGFLDLHMWESQAAYFESTNQIFRFSDLRCAKSYGNSLY